MSYDLNVYLDRGKMPSPENWKASITRTGFPVELDSDFDVDSFTGFLPCPVNGEISGFEYYSSKLSPDEVARLGLPRNVNFSIQFNIGSRPLELISALAASSVLTLLTGGLLVDPQSGNSYVGEEALAWAKDEIGRAKT
jgi:hypothetical protein